MSNPDFVKGACRHCAGHLEFPVEAIGETIPCPHCGQPTELISEIPPKLAGFPWKLVGVLVSLGLVIASAVVFATLQRAHRGGTSESKTAPTAQTNLVANAMPPPVTPLPPQFKALTNDFGLLSFTLEKAAGSSLVYVTGTIRNMTDHQRFGIKIEFSLADTNDNPAGLATDYQSLLEPHGEWRFKALVMSSKAVSAQLQSIAEDK